MRFWIVVFAAVSGLTGCTKYQYATVESNLQKNPRGEVVFENDSLRLKYRFNGADCPLQFQVYNKTDKPLYINWKLSHIDLASITRVDSAFTSKNWTEDLAVYKGAPAAHEIPIVSLIPPNGFAVAEPLVLRKRFFHLTYGQFETRTLGENTVRAQKYPRPQSPLRITSFIALSSSCDFSTVSILRNELWVDEVTETVIAPEALDLYDDRKNRFYVSKSSGLGLFSGSMGVLGYLMFMALTR